jgi:2-oxoglutarate ferredoxin oxidoreductase subunit gamma
MKIRFAGFGGQGIVLCGVVFGQAAMLDGRSAMQTQSYGSASRGGLTTSDVCIESGEIHDLIYDEFDVVVAMSAPSYRAFRGRLAEGGRLFYESDLVELDEEDRGHALGVPATQLAYDGFGRKIIANMIMMGFVNAICPLASREALEETIRGIVPPGTEDLNMKAFDEGAAKAEAADLKARNA